MIRRIGLVALFVLAAIPAWTQSIAAPRFVRGGVFDALISASAVDADGNFYFFGASPNPLQEEVDPPGSLDLDPGPGVWPLAPEDDAAPTFFVGKTDPELNLLWVKSVRTGANPQIYDIAVDSDGNVFATGWQLPVDTNFGEPGAPYIVHSQGTFIWKLNPDGTTHWARIWGSNSPKFYELATDLDGNVYATGLLNHSVDVDPGGGTYILTPTNLSGNNTGLGNAMVLKLNGDGQFQWAGHFVGADNVQQVMRLAVADDGTVFVGSQFYGQVDADPDPNVTRLYFSDLTSHTLIVALTDQGAFRWAYHTYRSLESIREDGEGGLLADYNAVGKTIERYSPQGSLLWQRDLSNIDIYDIVPGKHGDFYIYGFNLSGTTISSVAADRSFLSNVGNFIARWDLNGSQLWCTQVAPIGEQTWETASSPDHRIFPTSNGEIVVTNALGSVIDADPSSASFPLQPYNHLDHCVYVLGGHDEVWVDFDLVRQRRMDGTLEFPLRLFSRAFGAIDAGETVTIVSAGQGVTSAETGVFSKPATVRVLGASARIGQQP